MFITSKRRYMRTGENYTLYSSGTWVAPSGWNTVKVEAWGSGQNGGYDGYPGSFGGSGSAYSRLNSYSVTPGASYNYVIGTTLSASLDFSLYGATGSATYFVNTSSLLARGGGQVGSNVGDVSYVGGAGGQPLGSPPLSNGAGGGGGASAYSNGNGSAGANATRDGGTIVFTCYGGVGGTNNGSSIGSGGTGATGGGAAATSGNIPGGGGGGGSYPLPNTHGQGASGMLVITKLS